MVERNFERVVYAKIIIGDQLAHGAISQMKRLCLIYGYVLVAVYFSLNKINSDNKMVQAVEVHHWSQKWVKLGDMKLLRWTKGNRCIVQLVNFF